MLNITEKMQPMVKDVKIVEKNVYVVVANVKQFKEQVVATVAERPNKRRRNDGRFNALVMNFVRDSQNLHGKHVKVAVVAATDKDGLYRNEKGHFVKI